jgi:hypothetical protein
VHVTANVAALLGENPDPSVRGKRYDEKPYWHLERARIAGSRRVPVELIVNGEPVARREIVADGQMQLLEFDARLDRSSWIALRILPSSHTNPIFVLVNGKPIRASRQSAEWCLKAVDQCWKQKSPHIRVEELPEATRIYEAARAEYRKRLAESP